MTPREILPPDVLSDLRRIALQEWHDDEAWLEEVARDD